jgi:hypothetical protein
VHQVGFYYSDVSRWTVNDIKLYVVVCLNSCSICINLGHHASTLRSRSLQDQLQWVFPKTFWLTASFTTMHMGSLILKPGCETEPIFKNHSTFRKRNMCVSTNIFWSQVIDKFINFILFSYWHIFWSVTIRKCYMGTSPSKKHTTSQPEDVDIINIICLILMPTRKSFVKINSVDKEINLKSHENSNT